MRSLRSRLRRVSVSGYQRRTIWVGGVIVLLFGVLAARLVQLQVLRHEALSTKALRVYTRPEAVSAKRGAIYDRNGELLAKNQTVYTFYADAFHLRDHNIAVRGLAAAEALSAAEIRRKYDRKTLLLRYRYHLSNALHEDLGLTRADLDRRLVGSERAVIELAQNLEEDEFRALQEKIDRESLGGMAFRRETRRFYPSPHRLTHVLGFVDATGEGKAGIEAEMETILGGTNGARNVQRDSRGREITAFRTEIKPAVDGRPVQLTIDMGLQEIVERALEAGCERFHPEKACSIWMNPHSGEILALANRPHFDLSTREGNRRNFAIQDLYEPGSTFKIVAIGAAFDHGLVNPDSPVYCMGGELVEAGFTLHDSHPYGELTVAQIMAKSSNVGTYQVARLLGDRHFYESINAFGFNRKTRVHLTGEAAGQIQHPSNWSDTSFSRMAIGYEVAVTPLQMLNALGVVANGGELLRPRIVRSVDGSATLREVRGQGLSPAAAKLLTRTLIAVTQPGGTAPHVQIPGIRIAGKTGTARKYLEGGGYVDGHYVVSFMGFFPAENPQIMGIVVLDDPRTTTTALTGGTIAGPIFTEMARQAVAYLNMQPDSSPNRLAKQ